MSSLITVPVNGCGARESEDVCAGDDVDTVVDTVVNDVVDADAADVEVDAEASAAADVATSCACDVAIQEIGLFTDGLPSIQYSTIQYNTIQYNTMRKKVNVCPSHQ